MKTWNDTIDPSTIPDEVLHSEVGRRRVAFKQTHTGGSNGGRPTAAEQREREKLIVTFAKSFEKLDRPSTDLTGWLALKFSTSRARAAKYADWYVNGANVEPDVTTAKRTRKAGRA
jgi:hypothetical protein